MKITWSRLQTCLVAAKSYLQQNEKKSKLNYALERTKVKIEKLNEKLRDQIEDIINDTYYADENGVIVTDDQGRFKVTKESIKDRTRRQRELLETEIEYEPYFATSTPENLSEEQLAAFEDIVITREAVDRVRKIQEAKYNSPEASSKEND